MNRRSLLGLGVFAVIALSVSPVAGADIVDSLDSASDEETKALFSKLAIDSEASNKAVLKLLRSTRMIQLPDEEMPATVVGHLVLMQRKRVAPVFYPDLFALALEEHKEPPREFGWFSPTVILARTRYPELVPFLLDKISGEDQAGRRLATHLLGEIKDKRAVAPLEKLFLTQGDAAASVALYEILKNDMTTILLRACESPDAFVRELACAHLGNIGSPETLPALRRLLAKDGNPRVRAKAAYAMRFIKEEAAVSALREALADAAPLVKFKAAYTLAQYKNSDAGADVLVANLNTNADEDIREEAASGLIHVASPQAERALCRALKSEKVADVRYLVPLALEKHGSPNCLEPLFLALRDEDDRVRRNARKAIMAVVERHAEASVLLLKRISKQGSNVAREQAEECLRELNETELRRKSKDSDG